MTVGTVFYVASSELCLKHLSPLCFYFSFFSNFFLVQEHQVFVFCVLALSIRCPMERSMLSPFIIENSCNVPPLHNPVILSLNFASYINETNLGLKIATYWPEPHILMKNILPCWTQIALKVETPSSVSSQGWGQHPWECSSDPHRA